MEMIEKKVVWNRYFEEDFDELGMRPGHRIFVSYKVDVIDADPSFFTFKVYGLTVHSDGSEVVHDSVEIEGSLKWDGCYQIEGVHLDGFHMLDHYCDTIKFIYDKSDDIFTGIQ